MVSLSSDPPESCSTGRWKRPVSIAARSWVTNSVLHFKFTQSAPGQRRIHQTPDAYEVAACKPWLEAQLNRLRPELVILLGATAAKSLLGPSFRVTRQRGTLMPGPPGSGAQLIATIHPSAVLAR